jgi:hypothetical protein
MSAGKDQTTEPMAPASAPVLSPELEMVLQQPPPREVPGAFKSAMRRKLLGTAIVMFLFGLIFSIVGGIIVGVMFPWKVANDFKLATGAKSQATGTVSNFEPTNYRENKTRVCKVSYEFQTPDGKTHQGVSYQTGGVIMPGSEIQVDYLTSDPDINRGVGMRMNAIGYFILIFIFFPVIGFSVLIYSLYYYRSQMSKGLRLFSHGMLTQGTVSSVDKTNVRVNNQYRFKVTVSYMNSQTFYYAYGQDVMTASNWQGARTPLRVLYNPEKPDDAFVVESILKN